MWEPWDEAVLESPSLLVPGSNRLTLFYDVDLDGRIDYRGRFVFSEDVLSLVISGRGQAFDPVPVTRLDNDVVGVVHAVDVFFVALGEAEIESEVDLQVAMRSEFEGAADRAPDDGWIAFRSADSRSSRFRKVSKPEKLEICKEGRSRPSLYEGLHA